MPQTDNLFHEGGLELEQSFEAGAGNTIVQTIRIRGERFVTRIPMRERTVRDIEVAWAQAYLAGLSAEPPPVRRRLRAVDLFCGSGGLSKGLALACETLGLALDVELACDEDSEALAMYEVNHGPKSVSDQPVERFVKHSVAGRGDEAAWSMGPTLLDPKLARDLVDLDVLVAGPPCQGHSSLNNWTRGKDDRNLLYLDAVAFAVATRAKLCIIENVPDVTNDAHGVVRSARALFIKSGYKIDDQVLSADLFGVAQRRRRHFLVAVRDAPYEFDLAALAGRLALKNSVTVRQAISDLASLKGESAFDTTSTLSAENLKRIDWLFENEAWDLPDEHRPDCHKNGHRYPSVYGRMRWDEPAQTITTGFLTPGGGRFIHPGLRRTITPHEAARLQSFPDSYEFTLPGRPSTRGSLSKVIGDAVPPLLARAVATAGLAVLLGVPSA